jgi:hypothetical protein
MLHELQLSDSNQAACTCCCYWRIAAVHVHTCDDLVLCSADTHTFMSLAMCSCMLLLMWAHMLQLTHTPGGKQSHYKPTH